MLYLFSKTIYLLLSTGSTPETSRYADCKHVEVSNQTNKRSCMLEKIFLLSTSERRQSKTLLTIDKRGSKIPRNSDFDCHLSPVGRQMAIENSVSNGF